MADVDLAFEEESGRKRKKNPLEVLARAAHFMNPRQFELPKDVSCPLELSGEGEIEPAVFYMSNS